jgi:hypothetical protein
MSGEREDTRRRMEQMTGQLVRSGIDHKEAKKRARESAIRFDKRREDKSRGK